MPEFNVGDRVRYIGLNEGLIEICGDDVFEIVDREGKNNYRIQHAVTGCRTSGYSPIGHNLEYAEPPTPLEQINQIIQKNYKVG
jgi:hypothetical protein